MVVLFPTGKSCTSPSFVGDWMPRPLAPVASYPSSSKYLHVRTTYIATAILSEGPTNEKESVNGNEGVVFARTCLFEEVRGMGLHYTFYVTWDFGACLPQARYAVGMVKMWRGSGTFASIEVKPPKHIIHDCRKISL